MAKITFDPWQREAIEIRGGRHQVLAPPGWGNTDILTERVVHAHEQGGGLRRHAVSDLHQLRCQGYVAAQRRPHHPHQREKRRHGRYRDDREHQGKLRRICESPWDVDELLRPTREARLYLHHVGNIAVKSDMSETGSGQALLRLAAAIFFIHFVSWNGFILLQLL